MKLYMKPNLSFRYIIVFAVGKGNAAGREILVSEKIKIARDWRKQKTPKVLNVYWVNFHD